MAAIQPDPQGAAALIDYAGGTPGVDQDFAAQKYLDAYGQVTRYLGSLVLNETPGHDDAPAVATVRAAVLEVGSKLWDRRNAPGGEVTMDLDGTPSRLAPVDPMVTVYPVLNRLLDAHTDDDGRTLGGGFA